MKNFIFVSIVLGCLACPVASANSMKHQLAVLIEASCIHCHDANTETRLNFELLGDDLTDAETFRHWEKVFDRLTAGDMPPESEPQADAAQLSRAVAALKRRLRESNLADQHRRGRVPSRRLTRLEYGYTIRDLLLIDEDLSKVLPAENDSGGFDTVGETQGISAVHIRSYLKAADQALDAAINLARRPAREHHVVDYLNAPYVKMWLDRPLDQGGKVIKRLDDAVALFIDLDYVMRSDACGLHIRTPGRYRISLDAYAYQATSPVTLKLILASEQRGGAELLGAFDILPDQSRSIEVNAVLKPGDYLYPSVADVGPASGVYAVGGAGNYQGEGIAVKPLHVEGPLIEDWPPASTTQLLAGRRIDQKKGQSKFIQALSSVFGTPESDQDPSELAVQGEPLEQVRVVVEHLAPLAFRRPLAPGEAESFVDLARPAVREGREFVDVVRIPLRSILSSPQFLFFGGAAGKLDDYALASRLSYFLWKSIPDQELLQLAAKGTLSEEAVLRRQVERMLADEKSNRFVKDFLGQWLRLDELNATTPDEHLYPEFDDVLNQAIARESELFFAELIKQNLGVGHLIDSDFTFLNRRLAEHYGISDVAGQHFRRVDLADDSPRGGFLTQASVLKVTANGTVTSPVVRGNFVLTNLLGTPPEPPLPNVGSIEPDTRGKTTIRETLDAHRNVETCARCHREIDPPGFALESFDPIGGFRHRYRATSGKEIDFQAILRLKAYTEGPEVDPSGVTTDGQSFSDVRQFKQILLGRREQVARNFVSKLTVYATGSEIQFADREHVEAILKRTSKGDFPVRTIIHQIVQSDLFRNK